MSHEDIRHIYCDGKECCESINGYNPHAKNIDSFIIGDLKKRGWIAVEEKDVIDGYFCGLPLIIEQGETKHFCPNCQEKH